jgi:hypothetical protein
MQIDRMLRPILDVVGRHTAGSSLRPLAFTSFDPDICLALKQRVPSSPILFLTVGVRYPHADPRRTSLEAALAFAEENKLEVSLLEHSGTPLCACVCLLILTHMRCGCVHVCVGVSVCGDRKAT